MGLVLYYPRDTIPPPKYEEHHTICGEITPTVVYEHSRQSFWEAFGRTSTRVAVTFMAMGAVSGAGLAAAVWLVGRRVILCSQRGRFSEVTDEESTSITTSN